MHEIFLSYSRRDAPTVQALAAALADQGLSCWIDRSGIEEGNAYDTQIEDAIAQTRVVIVLWSQHSIRSHWVRAEAAYALGKHKLLPIALDNSEPPLQFLQIQTIDFNGWDGASDTEAFARLLSALAKRLDRPGAAGGSDGSAVAVPAPSKKLFAPLKADLERNWIVKTYIAAMVAVGLRFPEKVIEKQFREYFSERTFMIARLGFLLVFITYVIYGVSDMAGEAAINSTRFRYMVACPLLLAFYGFSYKKIAKQHSQLFIAAFALTLSICVYINVELLSIETRFSIQNGNGTMNFMLTLGAIAGLPLNFVLTLVIGATMNVLHALIMTGTDIPLTTSWVNYLHVNSMWLVACYVAFWREYQQRLSFAAELS